MTPYLDKAKATQAKKACEARKREENLNLLQRLERAVIKLEAMAAELDGYRMTYAKPPVSIPPTKGQVTHSPARENGQPPPPLAPRGCLSDEAIAFMANKSKLAKAAEEAGDFSRAFRIRTMPNQKALDEFLSAEDDTHALDEEG